MCMNVAAYVVVYCRLIIPLYYICCICNFTLQYICIHQHISMFLFVYLFYIHETHALYTSIYFHVRIRSGPSAYLYIYMYLSVCAYIYTHGYTNTRVNKPVYGCMHAHINTCIELLMCTRTWLPLSCPNLHNISQHLITTT